MCISLGDGRVQQSWQLTSSVFLAEGLAAFLSLSLSSESEESLSSSDCEYGD